MTSGRKILIAAVVGLLLLLALGRVAAGFAVDYLWFGSLDLQSVFWTRWTAGVAVRVVVGLLAAAVVFVNLRIAARSLANIRIRRKYANIEIEERIPPSWILGGVALLALFSGWWLSVGMGDPIATLAFLQAVPWGETDPVFGRDISFYVYSYPWINRVQTLAGVLLFWTVLLVLVAYVATTSVRWTEAGPRVTPLARRHLGVLIALGFVVLAWDLWLDRYEILMSGQGIGGALGYTDINARIPAKGTLAGLALIAAGSVGYGAWNRAPRPAAIGVGLLVVGAVIGQGVYPTALQRLRVEPNELGREQAYITMNLEATRRGYGLAGLDRRPLSHDPSAIPNGEQASAVLEGVPLWDPRPLGQTFGELQALFRYYDFESVHYDRYGPPGQAEQVAISVRELDTGGLPETAQTWQNLHLNYVRGAGAVVVPVSRMSAGGEPLYFVRDLNPPRVAPDAPEGLSLEEPSIFFGEGTRWHVLLDPSRGLEEAGTDLDDVPEALQFGAANAPLGVPIDAAWKRGLFAWAFGDRNLLLSGEVTSNSWIVYNRQIRERVEEIAPFLHIPRQAGLYPVIHEGRVVWILDGHTSTANYPLAAAATFNGRTVRYVRNSVKVTVDAVTGAVRLYAVDPEDPLLQTYRRIFPDLVRPIEEMPEGLQRHLRFPRPLFTLQASVLRTYHLRDARAFYNAEDVWDIPTETYGASAQPYQPYYAMLPLPGTTDPEFLAASPFVALGRQNMTAFFVTRNDPPNYGEQILYELPRDALIPGPQQVESMIDQDPAISEQLALWRRSGSDVIRGHMIVVPLGESFIYVEPIFLEAQETAIPQLERVILASGRRVVMQPNLESALAALLDGTEAPVLASAPEPEPGVGDEPGDPATAPTEMEPMLQEAQGLMQQAEQQLRAGDWAAFGATWERLRAALENSGQPQ